MEYFTIRLFGLNAFNIDALEAAQFENFTDAFNALEKTVKKHGYKGNFGIYRNVKIDESCEMEETVLCIYYN